VLHIALYVKTCVLTLLWEVVVIFSDTDITDKPLVTFNFLAKPLWSISLISHSISDQFVCLRLQLAVLMTTNDAGWPTDWLTQWFNTLLLQLSALSASTWQQSVALMLFVIYLHIRLIVFTHPSYCTRCTHSIVFYSLLFVCLSLFLYFLNFYLLVWFLYLYALSTIVDNKTKIIIMTGPLMKKLSIWKKIIVSVKANSERPNQLTSTQPVLKMFRTSRLAKN